MGLLLPQKELAGAAAFDAGRVRNKSSLGDMHTSKRKIKDTRFYVVQQKPTSMERTRTQLTL